MFEFQQQQKGLLVSIIYNNATVLILKTRKPIRTNQKIWKIKTGKPINIKFTEIYKQQAYGAVKMYLVTLIIGEIQTSNLFFFFIWAFLNYHIGKY